MKRLTRVQEFDMINMIKSHCKKNPEGFAEYDAEWSDEKIREAMGSICASAVVANLRTEFIGKIRNRGVDPTGRIEVLEKRIADLEKNAIDMMLALTKIMSWAKTRGFETPSTNGSARPISRPPSP